MPELPDRASCILDTSGSGAQYEHIEEKKRERSMIYYSLIEFSFIYLYFMSVVHLCLYWPCWRQIIKPVVSVNNNATTAISTCYT